MSSTIQFFFFKVLRDLLLFNIHSFPIKENPHVFFHVIILPKFHTSKVFS